MTLNLSADKKSERERFAGPLAIGGLIGAGLLLLVVLYPEKSLLRLLNAPDVTSPAQQRYLEALVHLRNGDTELVIPLVRSYLAAGCIEKAAKALEHQRGSLSAQQKKSIMLLQYELRRQQLEWMIYGEAGWQDARQRYAEQVEQMRNAGASPHALAGYLADARRLGDQETARKLEALLASAAGAGGDPASIEVAASLLVAKKDYRGAAQLYFNGMKSAGRTDQRRALFLAGVRTLQSGNLVQEALTAAEQHLTPELSHDRGVRNYMIRLSLAANRPDRAQLYVRQALGIAPDSGKSEYQP